MYMYFNTRRIGRICRCCVNMIKQQGEEFYNLPDIVSWKLKKNQNIHFRMFLSIFLFIYFLSQYMLYFKSYPLYSYNWPWDLKEVLEMLLLCKELLLWRSEHYCGSSTLIRRPNKITLRTSGDLLVLVLHEYNFAMQIWFCSKAKFEFSFIL